MKFSIKFMSALIFISLICVNSFSQSTSSTETASVSGVIIDISSGEPIIGATILLENTLLGTATDSRGNFWLKDLAAGGYQLKISSIGYQNAEIALELTAGETKRLNIELKTETAHLGNIVVERDRMIGGRNQISGMPGSAYFIGKSALAQHQYTDINRVLQNIPGINLQEEDGYGQRPNIGFRGTGVERSEKITIMEDGILIAPAPYAAPAAYYFPTTGRMEGIEIRKGSSQIKYGPYTTGGALNLLSTSIPADFAGRVRIEASQNNGRLLHAYAGDSFKYVDYLIETHLNSTDGFKELDNGGNTGFDKKDFLAKLRFHTIKTASIYQELMFKVSQTDETSNETYLGLTETDFESTPLRRYAGSQADQMITDHGQVSGRYFIQAGEHFDFTTTAYLNTFARNWYKLNKVRGSVDGDKISISNVLADPNTYEAEYNVLIGATSLADNALEVKANNREYYSRGVQSIFGIRFGELEFSHDIEIGFRFHQDQVDRFQWVDAWSMENGVMKLSAAGVYGTDSNRITDATAFASFVQYKMVWKNLTAIPGLRFEHIDIARDDYGKADPSRIGTDVSARSNTVSVWIPGIGLDYKLGNEFHLTAGVHKGFSPPGSKPETNPEESINYEIGSRYQTANAMIHALFFYNDYSNLLGSDLAAGGGTANDFAHNGGEVNVYGLEFSMEHDFARSFSFDQLNLPVSLSYTFTNATFQTAFDSDFGTWGEVAKGDFLPYLPVHQLAFGFGIEQAKWSAHTNGKFVGEMRTSAGQGDIISNDLIARHFVLDLSTDFALTEGTRLFVRAQNLLDATYVVSRRPAGLRPGLPRHFMAGVTTRF